MNRFKNYAKRFLKEDEGAELIEWAIVVAIAAILVTVAFTIANSMQGNMQEAGNILDSNVKDGLANAKGGFGGGGDGGDATSGG